ncbi:hypothetical protein NPIL_465231 [Nephila pilipes]|uniref:Uncharacterized protein n=1 Tax=Nephila pilipes TaxID=299642 RepID=A0A8X6TBY1_NEPPI|nr:hypothetical protein NPIL_465231 [Nephila pilipes]
MIFSWKKNTIPFLSITVFKINCNSHFGYYPSVLPNSSPPFIPAVYLSFLLPPTTAIRTDGEKEDQKNIKNTSRRPLRGPYIRRPTFSTRNRLLQLHQNLFHVAVIAPRLATVPHYQMESYHCASSPDELRALIEGGLRDCAMGNFS